MPAANRHLCSSIENNGGTKEEKGSTVMRALYLLWLMKGACLDEGTLISRFKLPF